MYRNLQTIRSHRGFWGEAEHFWVHLCLIQEFEVSDTETKNELEIVVPAKIKCMNTLGISKPEVYLFMRITAKWEIEKN